MQIMKIEGAGGNSDVCLDAHLSDLEARLAGRKTVIITDENVNSQYQDLFPAVEEVIVVAPGEVSKTLDNVGNVLRRLVELELDRKSLVVGIGGGVVTDLTGFVGSVFLRGVAYGFVATTVLAQVDAAIGGKNGVNLDGYKNLVGVIRQPEFVLNATHTLQSLSDVEMINGMSEVIKSGLIADKGLFALLVAAAGTNAPMDNTDMGEAISRAAAVKVQVVNRDVFEQGERRHLNLGHTLGHAIEKMQKIPHGYAVALGMVAAARMSAAKGMISDADADLIENTIAAFGLPVRPEFDLKVAMDAIRKDKKRQGDIVNYVLLRAVGEACVVPMKLAEVEEILNDLY